MPWWPEKRATCLRAATFQTRTSPAPPPDEGRSAAVERESYDGAGLAAKPAELFARGGVPEAD
jgi:hypothetical protein